MKEKELVQLCTQKHITIGSCESLTAGLFTSTIASVPGASKVLKGGLVTYFSEIKETVARVSPKIIHKFGVISEPCAMVMARNAREILDVDYCVSFTGNAGPDAMEGKPAGLVYCAIASKQEVRVFTFELENMDRNTLRQHVVDAMIDKMIQTISKE